MMFREHLPSYETGNISTNTHRAHKIEIISNEALLINPCGHTIGVLVPTNDLDASGLNYPRDQSRL